jgi:hypothetical protein
MVGSVRLGMVGQKGDWTLAGAFVCYALANFFLVAR